LIELGKYDGPPIKEKWIKAFYPASKRAGSFKESWEFFRTGRPLLTAQELKALWDIFDARFPNRKKTQRPPEPPPLEESDLPPLELYDE